MPNSAVTICPVSPKHAAELAGDIETRLLQSLRKSQVQAHNASVVLAARNDDGQLIGGLTAHCSYGWLLIKTLWVDETHRRCGIGAELMTEAEQFARTNHCHGIWLDTSSDKARLFYLALEYKEFGRLDNTSGQLPEDHHRWFLRKPCASVATAANAD